MQGRRRPITTEAIGSATTHPSLRGAQPRSHNKRDPSNPDGRTAAPGLLRFARNDGWGIGSLVSACRLTGRGDAASPSAADFIDMRQQVRGIVIDPKSSGLMKFIGTISATENADPQSAAS